MAVITGAGTGLGKSHALYLASRGAKVVVNDIGAELDGTGHSDRPAQNVVEEIRSKGGEAIANYESVTDIAGANKIIDTALDHFGTVDILINNAGILRDKTFINMSMENFEIVIQTHLLGSVYVTKAAFGVMLANNYGRIVLTTSGSGLFGNFGQTNYSAAKMGLVGFMNSLKLEGEKRNILVNTVSPIADTRMSAESKIFPKDIVKKLKPELISALVAYLSSKSCQSSGDIISAGGGYYSKVQVVEGPGIRIDPEETVTPEIISENYAGLTAMDSAVTFSHLKEEIASVAHILRD